MFLLSPLIWEGNDLLISNALNIYIVFSGGNGAEASSKLTAGSSPITATQSLTCSCNPIPRCSTFVCPGFSNFTANLWPLVFVVMRVSECLCFFLLWNVDNNRSVRFRIRTRSMVNCVRRMYASSQNPTLSFFALSFLLFLRRFVYSLLMRCVILQMNRITTGAYGGPMRKSVSFKSFNLLNKIAEFASFYFFLP